MIDNLKRFLADNDLSDATPKESNEMMALLWCAFGSDSSCFLMCMNGIADTIKDMLTPIGGCIKNGDDFNEVDTTCDWCRSDTGEIKFSNITKQFCCTKCTNAYLLSEGFEPMEGDNALRD